MKKKRSALGTILRSTRRAMDLTQAEVAKKTGVSASYISLLESGARKPSFEVMHDLNRLYQLGSEVWFQ